MSKRKLDRFVLKKVVGGALIVHTVEDGMDRYALYLEDSPWSLAGYEGEVFFSTLEEALEYATRIGLQNIEIMHADEVDDTVNPDDLVRARRRRERNRRRLNRRIRRDQCNIL